MKYSLEEQFNKDCWKIYNDTVVETKYRPEYYRQMLEELGGLNAAKQLLATTKPSEGFTKLWELGRLDLSVEALVIKNEYNILFTDEEISTAKRRLEELGYL